MSERRIMVLVRCEDCGRSIAWIERGGSDYPIVADVDERRLIYVRSASKAPRHSVPNLGRGGAALVDPRWPGAGGPLIPDMAEFRAICFDCDRKVARSPAEVADALDEYDRAGGPVVRRW